MAEALSGMDISKIMSEEGTVVKCVLLRCHPSVKGCKSAAENITSNTDTSSTALKEVAQMSIKEMKAELNSYGITNTEQFVEKREMMKALEGERSKRSCDAAAQSDDEDGKPAATGEEKPSSSTSTSSSASASTSSSAATTQHEEQQLEAQIPLSHLITEQLIDTTPRKSQVSQLLGGDFTFLGQYEQEGIMVMVRRPDWEKGDNNDVPDVNPHRLHPPLDGVEVRGDILLMRVAETAEELDGDDDEHKDDDDAEHKEGEDQDKEEVAKKLHVPSSEEFFLDYTRLEYLKFASRTDIVWEGPEQDEEEEESEEEEELYYATAMNGLEQQQQDDENDDDDAPYDPEAIADYGSDDDEYAEEHQIGMMNLILGQILRKFHEENGRGPNTLELLDMRKALADKLGVDVPEVDEEACDWDKKVETPKKHNRKVVVDEERNECETIEDNAAAVVAAECGGKVEEGDGVDDEKEGCLEEESGTTENGTGVQIEQLNDDTADLKRPPEAMSHGAPQSNEEQVSKKQKVEDASGDS